MFVLWLPTSAFGQAKISFDDALKQMISRSTSLRAQKARVRQADFNYEGTKWHFLPSISASGDWSSSRSASSSTSSQSQSASLEGGLRIFRFGGDLARQRAFKKEWEATQQDLSHAWLEAEQGAVRQLLELIQSHRNLEISQEIEKIQKQLLDIAQKRYRKGVLPKQEVHKIEIDLNQSQARSRDNQNVVIEAGANLEASLGSKHIELVWPWKEAIHQKSDELLSRIKALWKEEDLPSFRANRSRLAAKEQLKKLAWSQLLPTFDASASVGYQWDDSRNQFWSLGATVTVPLFSRLEDYSEYRAKSYAVEVQRATEEESLRSVRAEWKQASESYGIAVETAQQREKTLEIARKLYRDNLKRFRMGRISANDLAVDQQRLFNSELLAVRGWFSAHIALSRLCHAAGKRVDFCWSLVKK